MERHPQPLGLHEGSVVMTRHVIAFTFVAMVTTLVSCSGNKNSDPAPVIRPQEGSELCDEVASKLGPVTQDSPDALDCDFAYPVPVQESETISCEDEYCDCSDGMSGCISFEDWCVEQHANGVFWNTKCIMEQVAVCEEVETLCNTQ